MIRNIFACLVHESRDCVLDLVRNLYSLDPHSTILLYNGGLDQDLLGSSFPASRYGAVVHPSPRRMEWGRLHDFALDCMEYAIGNLSFDALTIVDSDQLATREGYSEFLRAALEQRPSVGLLSNVPAVLPSTCQIGPVLAAFQEVDLWRPLLQRFAGGEEKFAHWSFWPSTVFTRDAARDLVRIFRDDTQLQEIINRTQIWATEEVILPTITALLGYEIARNPCSYDFIKYREVFSPGHVETALSRPDVFWLHPIPRELQDPLRRQVRSAFGDYADAAELYSKTPGLVRALPILQRMKRIEGWFEEEEGDLLIAATKEAIASLPVGSAIVEVGSFCGRSTVVLGSVVQALGASSRVFAIDPHDGKVGAADQGLQLCPPTREIFSRNMLLNGLARIVEAIPKRSTEVVWDKPIGLLLIDGLHDYNNVSLDFQHFDKWVLCGGYVVFHDYADYYPGVQKFVRELIAAGRYQKVDAAQSLIVLRKQDQGSQAAIAVAESLVSCIMPTANRRAFVPRAIRQFLRQDYVNSELIVIDDGEDSVADLIPSHPRIRYTRLPSRITMGRKHNLACEIARGDVIVHWDDDDFHADWRISYQVRELLQHGVSTLCGLARIYFFEPRSGQAWEYIYPSESRPWVSGATFCYYRTFWEQHRFPDMNEGADTVFVWNLHGVDVVAHPEHRFYVAIVHATNTSIKKTDDPLWHPLPGPQVRSLMGEEDWFCSEAVRTDQGGH